LGFLDTQDTVLQELQDIVVIVLQELQDIQGTADPGILVIADQEFPGIQGILVCQVTLDTAQPQVIADTQVLPWDLQEHQVIAGIVLQELRGIQVIAV
jgi:hypothetical protein